MCVFKVKKHVTQRTKVQSDYVAHAYVIRCLVTPEFVVLHATAISHKGQTNTNRKAQRKKPAQRRV